MIFREVMKNLLRGEESAGSESTGPPMQSTGPPRTGAGVGIGMLKGIQKS